MKLTGQQYKQLQQALLDAFPTETDLQQLVMFELDENLAAIASGGNLQAIVFTLIGWAQAYGVLIKIILPRIYTDKRGFLTWSCQAVFSLYPRLSAQIRG